MNDLVPVNATQAQIERANKIVEYLAVCLENIPAGGGDGILGILESIIAAEVPEHLDRAWESAGFGQLIGYRITVDNPRKLESDFAGTLGVYLICDVTVHATGEIKTASTGSYAIMSQILVAHAKGMLPLDFVPHEAEEPTENGFYPQHLKVWRPGMADQPEARQPRSAARLSASKGLTREQRLERTMAEDLAKQAAERAAAETTEPGF